jgi:hypothetical protein
MSLLQASSEKLVERVINVLRARGPLTLTQIRDVVGPLQWQLFENALVLTGKVYNVSKINNDKGGYVRQWAIAPDVVRVAPKKEVRVSDPVRRPAVVRKTESRGKPMSKTWSREAKHDWAKVSAHMWSTMTNKEVADFLGMEGRTRLQVSNRRKLVIDKTGDRDLKAKILHMGSMEVSRAAMVSSTRTKPLVATPATPKPSVKAPVVAKLTGASTRITQALCIMWASPPMTIVELGEKLGHPEPKSGGFSSWFYHSMVWTGRVAHVGLSESRTGKKASKLWDLAYRTTPGYEEVPPEVA